MMHILLVASFTLPFAYSKPSGELCKGTGERAPDGNWYCSEVRAITYRNISQAGVYNRTTYVDSGAGICGHETVQYGGTGPLTPLFGEVSMHLRGPMNVSQLAVYQIPSDMHTLQKRKTVPFYNRRRALRKREAGLMGQNPHQAPQQGLPLDKRIHNTSTSCRPRTITATVTVTDCGLNVPTTTTVPTRNTTCNSPVLPCMSTPRISVPSVRRSGSDCTCKNTAAAATVLEELVATATSHPIEQAGSAAKRHVVRQAATDWSRVAYYRSVAPAEATGLSFLANLGDPLQSGTFDYAFGNSLSYVSSNGGKVTSESMPFEGTLGTSEREIAIFSDKACDQDCPYWRPNATSHFGWSGSSKAFFIEFQMDHYQNLGNDQGLISDAPAWWFLNAAIPRILQYGNDRNNIPCSCWSTGCGEFDAFELLGNGEERAKSTLHRQGNLEGGDSNYFKRPVGRMLKFAVIWHYPSITARVLDDDFDFSASLSSDQIQQLVSYDADSWVHSLFAIGN